MKNYKNEFNFSNFEKQEHLNNGLTESIDLYIFIKSYSFKLDLDRIKF